MTKEIDMDFKLFKKRDYYYVDFWLDGKRYKKTTKSKRRNDAEIIAKRIISETLEEIYGQTEMTLSQLISKYINHIQRENKTWKTKVSMIKLFFEFIGDLKLSKISPGMCEDFLNDLSKRNITKATVNRYIATFKHMFNKAIDWELMERNPMMRVKKSRETPRMRFFTTNELERLIAAAYEMSKENISNNQTIFYYILMTAIYSGMRLGEIINLKWMDIQDENFTIQKSKSGGKRKIPVKDELMDILLELPTDNEYIFPLYRRESDVITKIWHKVRERAGIKEGRFHDLRHTFGSNLIKSGVDIVTVKELLGHSDLKMTQIYVHSSHTQKQRAILKLDI
jgi:integrase